VADMVYFPFTVFLVVEFFVDSST